MNLNPTQPFQPWEADYGKRFFLGLGQAASSAAYVASNIYSWDQARKMPKLQAAANREVLELQKDQYDKLTEKMRDLLNDAITAYMHNIGGLMTFTARDSNKSTHFVPKRDTFKEAFPDIPKAAEYVPVDACCVQGATIECNISHAQRAEDLARFINRLQEQNDLTHALAGDPRFLSTLDVQSVSISDLSRGNLPVGDVVEVLTDTAEQAALTGRIGNVRRTTARDLGISKLRAQAAGRKEFREASAWFATSISPAARQLNAQIMMMSPQDRIQLALHQAQLIQQSLQNKNNALAQKAPWKMAELQTRIQQHITRLQAASSRALLQNTHLPNPALMVPAPTMDNITGLVGSIGQAINAAQQTHFFNAPGITQEGYQSNYGGNDKPAGYK